MLLNENVKPAAVVELLLCRRLQANKALLKKISFRIIRKRIYSCMNLLQKNATKKLKKFRKKIIRGAECFDLLTVTKNNP